MSYFDNLPDDITEEILRFISLRPRHKDWKSGLRVADVDVLLLINSNFQRQIRDQLRNIVLTCNKTTLSDENRLVVKTEDNIDATCSVLRHIGSAARSLKFQKSVLEPHCSRSRSFIDYVTNECSNLKSIVFEDFICDSDLRLILRTRGSILKHLALSFTGSVITQQESYWNFVWRGPCSIGARYVPRVDVISASLSSIARYCENLRRLELDYLTTCNYSFWESVGKTINELVIRFSPMFKAIRTLEIIEKYCRKLHSVEILDSACGFSLVESAAITKLYASYGSDLKHASMLDIDPSCCLLVAANCPNVQVHAGHMYRVDEQLEVLGPLVIEIRFDHLWTNLDPIRELRLRESFEKCSHVEKITSRVLGSYSLWTLDTFAGVFEKSMSRLEYFEWPRWLIDKEQFAEAIHTLAANTRNLRELKMTCESWEFGMFNELVDANRNLKYVTIALDANIIFETQVVLDILKSFTACHTLRHLIVKVSGDGENVNHASFDLECVRAFCWNIRSRPLFIRVGLFDILA